MYVNPGTVSVTDRMIPQNAPSRGCQSNMRGSHWTRIADALGADDDIEIPCAPNSSQNPTIPPDGTLNSLCAFRSRTRTADAPLFSPSMNAGAESRRPCAHVGTHFGWG